MKHYFHTCFTALTLAAAISGTASAATIFNGSFESGMNFWGAVDLSSPLQALGVKPVGSVNYLNGYLGGPNVVIPTQGNYAFDNGFDGSGPGNILLFQDIGTPTVGQELTFDYRAGWDLLTYGAVLNRSFSVQIQPAGGGAPLAFFLQLTAIAGSTTPGPNSDTGPLSGQIDLSSFAGTPIRVEFIWNVPQNFTGPANAQLDNVQLITVPEPSVISLGVMSLGALAFLRRRYIA